jgi:hypothetical protein
MTIVFFISGHGFGHASREVEIINALGRLAPGLRIVVRSAVSPSLLERTLAVPYELRPGACDTGIVQATSVAHDDNRTTEEAVRFYARFDDRIGAEVRALGGEDVGAIVGDIPPLAFEVAARLRVPSIAIANFTWDWIYEAHPGLPDAAPWLIERLRQAYRLATTSLALPFSAGLESLRNLRPIPLVARHAVRSRDETRRRFAIPIEARTALLSFGGYGMPGLDLTRVDCQGWTLVVTDRVTAFGGGLPGYVRPIDEAELVGSGFRYEDLVAAADVVITKPGYGIIAECIANDTAMLYTSRGVFREYDHLVREMPRYLRCRFIDQQALFAGHWLAPLEALMAQPPPAETMDTNGAEVAAEVIRDCVTR